MRMPDGPERSQAIVNAKTAGAQVWRFELNWSDVAPTAPPDGKTAADPGWTGYTWERTDARIRAISAAGFRPVPRVSVAPEWAEGPDRPPVAGGNAPRGTWRPSPSSFGRFAAALAKRYSGEFPDPLNPGATLPSIRDWQAWNEPNLTAFLSPQWRRSSSRFIASSPGHYARLLNAFYTAVKRVSPRNQVITAGTAPFGDLNDGDPRMPPARFWRELLCVSGGAVPKAKRCGRTVRFDALAHHPYPIGPPRRTARNKDDVVVPDLRKITRLLPAALRAGTVRPRRAKPLWITEISWDSRPDPDGLSLNDQAQYLQASLYVLWRQGAQVVTWWNSRDEPPNPSFAATYQSGVFLRGSTPAEDRPKPSFTAFRFPFTAYRTNGVARLWGKTPDARSVTIQAQQGGRWVTAARLRAGSNRIFTGRLRVGPNTPLRAVAGTDTSLTWRTQ